MRIFHMNIFVFTAVKNCSILHRRVIVMRRSFLINEVVHSLGYFKFTGILLEKCEKLLQCKVFFFTSFKKKY